MAVYTEVSFEEASTFLSSLKLGTLQHMQGCAGGIENTNYFVTTDQAPYVLTLFERLHCGAIALLPAPDEAPGRARHSGA